MKGARILLLGASAMSLAGCGAYSFAPPEVSLSHATPERSLDTSCTVAAGTGDAIPSNFEGAQTTINNYIDAYRCTLRIAADGRQAFQLPGFLSLVGSATAAALGAGDRWSVAGGAASSIFAAGNSYYDPPKQVEVLTDALEALDCIQMESVGATAYLRAERPRDAAADARAAGAAAAVAAAQGQVQDARDAVARADRDATRMANIASRAETDLQAFTAVPALRESATAPARAAELREQATRMHADETTATAALRPAEGRLSQAQATL